MAQRARGFREKVKMDLNQYASRAGKPPTALFFLRYWLLSPGFRFVFNIRLSQAAIHVPLVGKVLRRLIWLRNSVKYGCEVAPNADIGGGLYTPHPYGIVVGDACRIGENVSILQNVTIGVRSRHEKRVASIGDNAFLSAGAAIIGDILIGEGATVGANAVVLKDVPAGKVAVGNPAVIRG